MLRKNKILFIGEIFKTRYIVPKNYGKQTRLWSGKQKYPFFRLIQTSLTFTGMSKFTAIALFFLFACNPPKIDIVEKPKDLIPEVKMVQLLADVHMLEAALNVRSPQILRPQGPITLEMPRDTVIRGITFDHSAPPPIEWYDIFTKREVTKEQFETSMQWYGSQPEELSLLYDDVITELTTRQLKAKSEKKADTVVPLKK